MSARPSVETFEVDSTAKMTPADSFRDHTDSTKVLVYIDHENKVIYLWRGKEAGVIKKLLGTRIAALLSHKYNDYRIRPVAEENEPAAFRALISSQL